MSTFAEPEPTATTRDRLVLLLLCAAQFLLILDVTVVNVAVPSLSEDLRLSAADAQWTITAYTVPFGALLLAGGRAGDRWGRRSVLVVGLLLFAAGSGLAAVAGDVTTLLAGRVLQGVAAAAVSPSALALLVTVFPTGAAHRRAFAAWAAVGAGGAAAGVLVGGVLTSAFGWRSVFYVGIPVAVALALAGSRMLPAAVPTMPRRLDGVGTLLAVLASGAALLGAARAAALGFGAGQVLAAFAAAAAATVVLALRLRTADDPLVAPHLLRRRSVLVGTTLMALAAGTLVTSFYLSSLLLQDGYGHSAVRTGLEFLPAALATLAGAHAGAHVLPRVGSRPVAAVGMLLAAAGALLLAGASTAGTAATQVIPGLILLSLGLGGGFVIANTTTMSDIGPGEAGTLAGLSTTAHELGIGFVLATVVAVSAGAGGFLPIDRLPDAYTALAAAAMLGLIAALAGLRRGEGVGSVAMMGH